MHYGISQLSLIPVRKEPSEQSEMVTQILFGENFEIIEEIPKWCYVKLAWDGYTGWTDTKMITPVDERVISKIEKNPIAVTSDIFNIIEDKNGQATILVAGSTLPNWRPYLKRFTINKETYMQKGAVIYGKIKDPRELILSQAYKYYNAPYLWGGRSPLGIDCSGFSQVLYKMIGIKIPRDASQQACSGQIISSLTESEPGDLAFFENEEGRIVHVGLIWKHDKIIHASGRVRIDKLDHYGIFDTAMKCYTHKLCVLKKIINAYGKG